MYGSSRLGIKKYTPNQIYINKNFDQSQTNPEVDSTTFDFRLPWYSNQYQDIVSHLVDTLNGAKIDKSEGYLSHIIGQKQYELNNHLGNVQAVVSDNIVNYDYDNDSLIDEYHAAIPVAYDYYPFGSLMPGRYVQDTGKHCFTTMQTKTVWDWGPVFEPGDVSGWASDASWAVTGTGQKSSSTDVDGETVMLKLEAQTNGDGLVNEEVDSEPGVETEFVIAIGAAEGRFRAQVEEQIGSEWVTLDAVDIDREGEYLLTYTSETNNLKFSMKSTTGVSTYGAIYISEIRSDGLVPTLQQVPVQICSSVEDRYRMGFNSMEKDNEIAGIGNRYEFKYRGYDARTGRFMTPDPLHAKYPWNSDYAFAENSPIQGVDLEGLELIKVNSGWFRMKVDGGKTKIVTTRDYNLPSVFKDGLGRSLFTPASIGLTGTGYINFNNGPVILPPNKLPPNPAWPYAHPEGEPTNNVAGGYIGTDVEGNRAFADRASAVASAPQEIHNAIQTIKNVSVWKAYEGLKFNIINFDRSVKASEKMLSFSDGFDPQTTADLTNFLYDGTLPILDFKNIESSVDRRLKIMEIGMPILKHNDLLQPETSEMYKQTKKYSEQLSNINVTYD